MLLIFTKIYCITNFNVSAPSVIGKFISDWNNEFPDYTLTTTMLTDPHAVIGAIFQVFDRLGIDRDAVVMVTISKN